MGRGIFSLGRGCGLGQGGRIYSEAAGAEQPGVGGSSLRPKTGTGGSVSPFFLSQSVLGFPHWRRVCKLRGSDPPSQRVSPILRCLNLVFAGCGTPRKAPPPRPGYRSSPRPGFPAGHPPGAFSFPAVRGWRFHLLLGDALLSSFPPLRLAGLQTAPSR